MPPSHGLRVVRSSIHGYGVIALRSFAKGELVTYGDGVIFHEWESFDDEYALILRNPDYDPETSRDDEEHIYYDLADQTRWINHGCDPNTEVDSEWDPLAKMMTTWWSAARDIAPGEELTYDYAFSGHLAVPCLCGKARCRGLIIDPERDEVDRIPEGMRPHISEYLARLVGLDAAPPASPETDRYQG